MDAIDNQIMDKLRKDARTPYLRIAKELQVSEGTIRKRVGDLIKSNEISKFTIETSSDVFAIVGVETETKTETKKIVDKIKSINVDTIYEVTGRFDIICHIPSNERNIVNDTLEEIRAIDGVLHTETFTVLLKS